MVANAVYTLNQCPTKVLCFVTPKKTWSGRKFCIAHMRMFGSIAYTMVMNKKRDKLDPKGTKCLFLKYLKE